MLHPHRVLTGSILFCVSLLFASCTQQSTSGTTSDATEENADSTSSVLIHKDIPVSQPFYQITNLSSIDIEVVNGPCHVEAIGDSLLISSLSFECDGGGLTVTMLSTAIPGLNKFKAKSSQTHLVISCPELRILANCGNGNIYSHEPLHTTQLHVGGMSAGRIQIDTLYCHSLKWEQGQQTEGAFGFVKCNDAMFLCYGTSTTSVDSLCCDSLFTCDLSNGSALNAHVSSPVITSLASGQSKATLHSVSNEFSLSAAEQSEIELTGKCRQPNIKFGSKAKVVNRMTSL